MSVCSDIKSFFLLLWIQNFQNWQTFWVRFKRWEHTHLSLEGDIVQPFLYDPLVQVIQYTVQAGGLICPGSNALDQSVSLMKPQNAFITRSKPCCLWLITRLTFSINFKPISDTLKVCRQHGESLLSVGVGWFKAPPGCCCKGQRIEGERRRASSAHVHHFPAISRKKSDGGEESQSVLKLFTATVREWEVTAGSYRTDCGFSISFLLMFVWHFSRFPLL